MEDISFFEFKFQKLGYDEYYRPLIEVDVWAEDKDETILSDSREEILLKRDGGFLWAAEGESARLAEHLVDWREARQPDFKERLEKTAAQLEKDLNNFLSNKWVRDEFEKFETDFLNKDDALCDLTDLRLLKIDQEKDQAVFTVRVADERPVNLNLTPSKLYDFNKKIKAQLTAALGADKVSDIVCMSLATETGLKIIDELDKQEEREAAGMTEGPGKVYISLERDQFVERNELEKLGAKRERELWTLDESKVKDLKNRYEVYRDKELTQKITDEKQTEIKPRGRGR